MNLRKYEWTQTQDSVIIVFPISSKINHNSIDSVITDTYIKINIPDIKFFVFLDLESEITDDANLLIENDKITINLKKKNPEKWSDLLYKGKGQELKDRRKKSTEEYERKMKEKDELGKAKKREFEKFVLEKSIKDGEDKRKELTDRKKKEKNDVESDLYKFVESYNENNNEIKQINDEKKQQVEKQTTNNFERFEDSKNIVYQPEKTSLVNQKKKEEVIEYVTVKKSNTSIFNEKEVDNETVTNDIREQSSIKVNLTKKKIAHFAARESLSKEPPYPKSKNFAPQKNEKGIEIDERNPIWIKEKADTFYNNNDFLSAIQAYNRCLEIDSQFHKCILNRATCFIRLGDFKSALENLESLKSMIENLDKKERDSDPFYEKVLVRAMIKIYPIKAMLGYFDEAIYYCDQINEFRSHVEEKNYNQILKDRENIEKRKLAEEHKNKADLLMKTKDFESAKKSYIEIIHNNPDNERVISNLSSISLNNKEYHEALNYCTKALKIIKITKEKINLKKYDNSFELKVLLRRAKCHEELMNLESAQKDIEDAEKLEIQNDRISQEINEIKENLKIKIFEKFNDIAKSHLEKREFQSALDFFNKSISLMKNVPKFEVIKVYINRIATLLGMEQYHQVDSECARILILIQKQKKVASGKGDIEFLQKISDIESILYVRKGFALSKMNRILDSLKEYEKAAELKPNDEKIKANINELKKNL